MDYPLLQTILLALIMLILLHSESTIFRGVLKWFARLWRRK